MIIADSRSASPTMYLTFRNILPKLVRHNCAVYIMRQTTTTLLQRPLFFIFSVSESEQLMQWLCVLYIY